MNSKHVFRGLYLLLLVFSAVWMIAGRTYYLLPPARQVRHPMHAAFRQSGSLGHLLGILGALFMLLLLLYSIRKRFRFARRWGNLNVWLSAHIFLGFAGPVLVLFHTAFKFSGIVSISFWSMTLVVVSGILGKYIFELIPHSISGMELSRIEMEAEEIGITFEMRRLIPAGHSFWQGLADLEGRPRPASLLEPVRLLFEPSALRRHLGRMLRSSPGIDRRQRRNLVKLVVRRHMLARKANLLQQTMKILHYWHLVHKPFVIIMFLILLLHVYVTVRMGYSWKF